MRHVVVRYKVNPAKVPEHLALVRAVFAELEQRAPAGLNYAAVRGADGVSFTHVARTEPNHNPLNELASFQEFQRDIRSRCDEPPAVSEVEVVGNYKLFE